MQDMIEQTLEVGDFVMYPDGNPRYGGLKFTIGIIVKMTEKRISLAITDLLYNNKAVKTVNKTGHKVLKLERKSYEDLPSFKKIESFLAV